VVSLGSSWGQAGVKLGSTSAHYGVDVGSMWGQRGVNLRSSLGQPAAPYLVGAEEEALDPRRRLAPARLQGE